MKEMLKELLKDYLEKYQQNQDECIQLIKNGLEWKETAKKVAGLKLMIQATLIELKKYE